VVVVGLVSVGVSGGLKLGVMLCVEELLLVVLELLELLGLLGGWWLAVLGELYYRVSVLEYLV